MDLPDTMRATVLLGAGRLELQERAVPEPAPDEVLVRVRSVGVCGSDVHYYQEGRIGSYVVKEPLVLGHEASGVVVAVGSQVTDRRVGQRVAIEPQRPCRHCRHCKAGRLNLCPHMAFYATPPVDGALCDFVTAPADFAHPVPEELSDHVAALLEPLSVGLWACHKADVAPGDRVLVTGAGPIGALTAVAARARGAAEVVVTDLVASRRERVSQLGATAAYDPREADLGDLEADAFIECSGATAALTSGLQALRGGGTAVMVGLGADRVEIPVAHLAAKEIVLTGVFRYVDTWPAAIAVALGSPTDLETLVTAEFDLEHAEEALLSDADPASMKSVVVVSRT